MFRTLTTLFSQNSQRSSLSHQARLLETQAKATRIRGEAQAGRIERAAERNQEIANYNLRAQRENQREGQGTIRTNRGASGFTSEGTGDTAEQAYMSATDRAIANQAFAASVVMSNAWQTASDTRRAAAMESDILTAKANSYRTAAKGTQRAMWATGIAGAIGAVAGAYQANKANNALQSDLTQSVQEGTITQAEADAAYQANRASVGLSALQGMDDVAIPINSFNPYTASLTGSFNNRRNNWGGLISMVQGRTPYNITGSNNLLYD